MLYWFMPRFTHAAFGAATLGATTAVAASVTIAHRMMLLSDPAGLGRPSGQAEARRMVAEKLDAAAEGSMEAALEAGRFMLRSAWGGITPDEVAHGLMTIGLAAARPAARRAKANARRLTRRS